VAALCAKAIRPKPGDASIPSVAAICVYPLRVPDAREHLKGSGVHVASVATAFPSGQSFTSIKVDETRQTVEAGADEVDMVIDRGAFLSGDYQRVYDEIVAVKDACGSAHLKVILETGELGTDVRRRASSPWRQAPTSSRPRRARSARGDAACELVMMERSGISSRDGRPVGFKAAGGIAPSRRSRTSSSPTRPWVLTG
jgi:deoxyribose-phosphate aldolase